jgi:hypothetical protein
MRLQVTTANNWGFNLLRIKGLMRLEVSDCEQRELLSHAAHHESAVASGIRLRTTGLYSPAAHNESAVASGIRLRTTGLFSPAAHHESAVASGIRLRTTGLFHLLHIMSLCGFGYPTANNEGV